MSVNVKVFGDFYYLDDNEKKRFIQSNHEYIIEQVQLNNNSSTKSPTSSDTTTQTGLTDYELNFSHPIKYFVWVVVNEGTQNNNSGMGPCYFVSLTTNNLYGSDGESGTVELLLEGVEREAEKPMIYYTRLLPDKYCNTIPVLDRIGMYSFALNPFDPEPSGTCNFSKLYDKSLKIRFGNRVLSTVQNKDLYIFGVNYNILTITNGMAALRYA